MLRIDKAETYGWEAAFRGMRNAFDSHGKSDSYWGDGEYVIGDADMELAMKLCGAGAASHRKFLRQIFVTCDITAPLYLWKQIDTYKVGTVTNSDSTMHMLGKRRLTSDDFSTDSMSAEGRTIFLNLLKDINDLIDIYKLTGDRECWGSATALLPSCYNQKRTWSGNYEVLRAMYHDRKAHKLSEWRMFCEWVETLPYSQLITGVSA